MNPPELRAAVLALWKLSEDPHVTATYAPQLVAIRQALALLGGAPASPVPTPEESEP